MSFSNSHRYACRPNHTIKSSTGTILQTISEEALGKENIVIDIQMLSKEDLQNVTLFAPNAAGEDWDLSDNVGWSPDYQDPSTYLDTLSLTSGGSLQNLGLEPRSNQC